MLGMCTAWESVEAAFGPQNLHPKEIVIKDHWLKMTYMRIRFLHMIYVLICNQSYLISEIWGEIYCPTLGPEFPFCTTEWWSISWHHIQPCAHECFAMCSNWQRSWVFSKAPRKLNCQRSQWDSSNVFYICSVFVFSNHWIVWSIPKGEIDISFNIYNLHCWLHFCNLFFGRIATCRLPQFAWRSFF